MVASLLKLPWRWLICLMAALDTFVDCAMSSSAAEQRGRAATKAGDSAQSAASQGFVLTAMQNTYAYSSRSDTSFPDSLPMASIAVVVFLCLVGLSLYFYVCRGGSGRTEEQRNADEEDVKTMEAQRASLQEQIALLGVKIQELKDETAKAEERARRAEAEAAAAAAEAALAEAQGDDTEELLRLKEEADATVKAMDENLERAAATAEELRRLSHQAVEKATQIETMLVDGTYQTWNDLEAHVRQTMQDVTTQLEDILEAEASQKDIEAWSSEVNQFAGSIAMPMPLLIASFFAPVQLQAVYSWNWIVLVVQLPMLITFLVVILVDRGVRCGDNELWVWVAVHVSTLAFSIIARWRLVRFVKGTLRETSSEEEQGDDQHHLAHLASLYMRILGSSKDYLKDLLAYDGVTTSTMSTLVSMSSFVVFAWGCVGVYFVIANAVNEEAKCPANALRFATRAYAFFFVAFFLWSLIGMCLWILEILIESKWMAMALLEKAWEFDAEYSPSGFPVMTVLVRALLMRNDKDRSKIEAAVLREEILELKERKAELAKEATVASGELSKAEQRLEVVTSRPTPTSADELAELYSKDLTAFVDKASVAALAAHAQVERLCTDSNMDALQGAFRDQQSAMEGAVQGAMQDVQQAVQHEMHDLGLDTLDYDQISQQAKDSLEQLTVAALLKAQEHGIDVKEIAGQVQSQAVLLATEVREQGEQLAAATTEFTKNVADEHGIDVGAIAEQVQTQAIHVAAEAQKQGEQLAAAAAHSTKSVVEAASAADKDAAEQPVAEEKATVEKEVAEEGKTATSK